MDICGPRYLVIEAPSTVIVAVTRTDENGHVAESSEAFRQKLANGRQCVLSFEEIAGDAERVHLLLARHRNHPTEGSPQLGASLPTTVWSKPDKGSLQVTVGN